MNLRRFCAIVLAVTGIADVGAAEELVPYRIENGEIRQPLTPEPGNPGRGRQIVRDQAHVTCLICHRLPIPEEPDHGEVGPDLRGVGNRQTVGQLRLRLVDPQAFNPKTIMSGYYKTKGLNLVLGEFRDRPIYSAQQIEDVVSYLAQMTEERR